MTVEKLRSPQAALASVALRTRAFSPPTENVPAENATGRILAEDIRSSIDVPWFARSWLDGYATKAKWTESASAARPAVLSLAGRIYPEDYPMKCGLGTRDAFFVSCGAPLPSGANCIIRAEDVRVNGRRLDVLRRAKKGDGLSQVGEDVRKGSLLAKKHQIVRPQDLGLIIAVGKPRVAVFRKPKLGILAVGNEIVDLDHFTNGIINSDAYLIYSAAEQLGVQPISLGIAKDDVDEIAHKLSEGVRLSDAVVTIGGCSVGPADLVPNAISKLGKILFHGVRIRPGHVAGAGVVDGKTVFMLPGHISSCTMAFYIFAVPTLARLAGTTQSRMLPRIKAESTTDVERAPIHTFLRLRLRKSSGRLLAEPIHGGSNIISSLSRANGFALIPPHVAVRKGEEINVTLFSRLEHARFS